MRRAALMCVAALVFGCSPAYPETATDVVEVAIGASAERVGEALASGQRAELERDWFRFTSRYNPAECDCPPWEVVLRGRWTRVWLEATDESRSWLEHLEEGASADHTAGLLRDYVVLGQLSESSRTAETGMPYQTLTVLYPEGLETPENR